MNPEPPGRKAGVLHGSCCRSQAGDERRCEAGNPDFRNDVKKEGE